MKQIGKDEVVFYIVLVISGSKKWVVKRRHTQFQEFDKHMGQKHPNMPVLPQKSRWTWVGYDIDVDEMAFYL